MDYEPRLIWKAGVPLNQAWLHFAEAAAREEHAGKPGFSGTVQQLVSVAASTRDGKLILSALQTVGKAHLDEMESRTVLQGALVAVLTQGRLIATGYVKGREPVAIDPQAFAQAGPDWEKAVVHVAGAAYRKVRITDPADIRVAAPKKTTRMGASAGAKAKAVAGAGPGAKAGAKTLVPGAAVEAVAPAPAPVAQVPASTRRSKASESIRAAIARLIESESGIAEMTRKTAAQMIRDQIGMDYQKGNGLSDPNLARHVRRVVGVKMVRREQGADGEGA
jgi:hypothetical protein